MNYRLVKPDDFLQIKALCDLEGLKYPNIQIGFVAEVDGKIEGFVSMAMEPTITCLISKNPLASRPLMDMVLGATSIQNRYIRCETARQSVSDIAEKFGFVITSKNMTLLVKEL